MIDEIIKLLTDTGCYRAAQIVEQYKLEQEREHINADCYDGEFE
jgi:hypothetical protein